MQCKLGLGTAKQCLSQNYERLWKGCDSLTNRHEALQEQESIERKCEVSKATAGFNKVPCSVWRSRTQVICRRHSSILPLQMADAGGH